MSENKDKEIKLNFLKDAVEKMVSERNWSKFHNAKNLSIGISIEAAELMEHFVWIEDNQVDKVFEQRKEKILEECADILIALIALSNHYDIDLSTIVLDKIEKIKEKYPIEKSFGKPTKYTEL